MLTAQTRGAPVTCFGPRAPAREEGSAQLAKQSEMQPAPYVPDEEDIHPEEARARSRIRRRRRELDYTLSDVAYMTGISASRLKRMEAGDPKGRKPDLRAILTLALVLKVESLDDVVEDWFWPPAPKPPDPDWLIRHGHEV